jgi:hypothetical protein
MGRPPPTPDLEGYKLRLSLCARAGKCAMAAITMCTSTRTDPGALFLPRHRMLSPGVAWVIAKQAGWLD